MMMGYRKIVLIRVFLISISNYSALRVGVPSGIIPIFKPKGISSNSAVQRIKYILQNELRYRSNSKVRVKVGHGGTLDPMADGVLVLGIEAGTKALNSYLSGSKGYRATGLLGTETDTLDATGITTLIKDCSSITLEQLENSLHNFRGKIKQIPPMYSALNHKGVRLYELARSGVTIDRESRDVEVYSLSMATNNSISSLPHFSLDIECSGGFYVRTLIEDLGRSVGGAAHMIALTRTKQGPFVVEDCLSENQWTFNNICDRIDAINLKLKNSPDAGN
jgi:tRNA pseudouridine55 synthase